MYKFLLSNIVILIIISCSVIPKQTLDKKQVQALNEIEIATKIQANKYAMKDLNQAIASYNNAQKYLVQASDDVYGLAYNSFLESIEQAKRAKNKANFFYTKELIDNNNKIIEKKKKFLKSAGTYDKYTIQNYYNLTALSNKKNINLAQSGAYALYDEIKELSKFDASREDDSLLKNYLKKEKIFIERGKAKIKVTNGYTLPKIAKDFLGDPSLWVKIYELNRANILNPNRLRAGQKIILPPLTNKAKRK